MNIEKAITAILLYQDQNKYHAALKVINNHFSYLPKNCKCEAIKYLTDIRAHGKNSDNQISIATSYFSNFKCASHSTNCCCFPTQVLDEIMKGNI